MKSESGSLGALSVGVRLKLARDMRGLTMTEVADEAGIAASTVNVIEKGQKQPRGDTVERLARALGVSRCWLTLFPYKVTISYIQLPVIIGRAHV